MTWLGNGCSLDTNPRVMVNIIQINQRGTVHSVQIGGYFIRALTLDISKCFDQKQKFASTSYTGGYPAQYTT